MNGTNIISDPVAGKVRCRSTSFLQRQSLLFLQRDVVRLRRNFLFPLREDSSYYSHELWPNCLLLKYHQFESVMSTKKPLKDIEEKTMRKSFRELEEPWINQGKKVKRTLKVFTGKLFQKGCLWFTKMIESKVRISSYGRIQTGLRIW